jgi:integrase
MALLLLTGMRRGEVLGLRWEDIDFEKKIISVQRNISFPTNQPNITTPKTENGVRQVPLDDNLIVLLDLPAHAKGYVVGGRKPITLMRHRYVYEKIEWQVDLHEATAHIFRHNSWRCWMPQVWIQRRFKASRGTGTSRSP